MAKNPSPSALDPGQILKRVYDEANDQLRTTIDASININGQQTLVISDAEDSVKIGDGSGNYVGVTAGSLNVNLSGGVGSVNQGSPNTIANAWPFKLTDTTNSAIITAAGALKTDASATTQPVSGTITANIGTTNGLALDTTLSTLIAKFNSLGQKAMASSVPVAIASDQSSIPVTGTFFQATQPVSGTIAATQSGTWNITNISGTITLPTGASTSSLQTTGNTSLSSIDTKTPSLGQALAAASVPVVLTSSQLTTLTPLSSVTVTQGTGTNLHTVVDSGTVAATQSGTWNITNLSGTVSLPTGASTSSLQTTGNSSLSSIDGKLGSLGQKAMTGSAPVVLSSDQSAIPVSQSGTWNVNNVSGTISLPTGASTSSLQTTGNTSLSSIDTKTPALGQALAAASVPVVLTATQLSTLTPLASVTVTQGTGTNLHTVIDSGTVTANLPQPSSSAVNNVSASATSVTLLALNTSRKGAYFYNNSTVNLYLKLGSSASSSSKTITMATGSFFELAYPTYTGIITGAWDLAVGSVDVTEVT